MDLEVVDPAVELESRLLGHEVANPEGGVIRREQDGKTPNGVLEEAAAWSPRIPVPLKTLVNFKKLLFTSQTLVHFTNSSRLHKL